MERRGVLLLAESAAALHCVDLWEVLGDSTETHICKARDEVAATLYSVGLTLKEIGRMFGRVATTIRDSVRRMGIQMRRRGGRGPVAERWRKSRGQAGENVGACSAVAARCIGKRPQKDECSIFSAALFSDCEKKEVERPGLVHPPLLHPTRGGSK